VNQSYSTTYGVAVRAENVDREALHVAGIVRGVNATIVESEEGSERHLRRSRLSIEVIHQTNSHATLRIEIYDVQTGDRVIPNEGYQQSSLDPDPSNGYITLNKRRVELNASGVAVVTVDEPGIYTARYHPASWIGRDPVYVGDRATIRWHPLQTFIGWFSLLVRSGWQLLPFVIALYGGRQLLRLLRSPVPFRRNP
jgi:hypothetical protein